MKRVFLFFHIMALCAAISVSCVRERLPDGGGDGPVKLRLTISALDETVVETKAAGDDLISSIYVLVFDGNTDNAKLIDWAEASSVGAQTYYASLKPSTTSGYVYVMANVSQAMARMGDLGGMTLEIVKAKLVVLLDMSGDRLIIEDPMFGPMNSQLLDYSSTDALRNADKIEVGLKRTFAQVAVTNQSANASYEILGANLGNAPVKGYVFQDAPGIPLVSLGNYAGNVSGDTYSVEQMMREVSATDPTSVDPLYSFESAATNEPFVIVKGSYDGVVGYHRLNLWNRTTEQYFEIKRNYKYIVTINRIATPGYRTAQQAIDSKASNRDVDYDVTVVDPYSHDIVTNGKQYLGVSNSELVVYRTGAMQNFVATVLSFTIPADQTWSPGQITAVGDGLTLSGASGTGKTLSFPAAETKGYEVKVNFAANFTSGTLTLQVGDLGKVVTITKKPNLPAVAEEMKFEKTSIGDRGLSGTMKKNIYFASESGMYANPDPADDIFKASGNELYAVVRANVGYRDHVSERTGEFYVAASDNEGRTKIWFYQEKLDVYTQLVQIKPYTYVGTFHRADQTAERIIRIRPLVPDASKTWTAMVVVGEDFIELDTDRSPDPGITEYPYGYDESDPNNTAKYDNAVWKTDAEIEANCQFRSDQKGKSVVTGTGDRIYFRVGMRSQLAVGDAAKTTAPRYGLIAFLHQSGTHLIYVRQGECEDYLLRPTDPIDDNPGIRRTDAVRILPYNITVPDDKKTLKQYDVPVSGGALTKYPSQGGYFFQGDSRRAYFPVGSEAEVGWTNNSRVNTGGTEVCPTGYRRPADGADGNSGMIVGSEMRQSFWLKPRNGEAQSNYDNMLRGYIADGYYDRRVMRVPNTQGHTNEGVNVYSQMPAFIENGVTYGPFTVPTMVGEGAECAYAGVLLYNPNNYASVFVPATGSRFGQMSPDGRLQGTGAESNLWSSTNYGGQMWYLATGYYYGGTFVFDNYKSATGMQGFSIRCVKK